MNHLRPIFLLLLLAVSQTGFASPKTTGDERPNIILIMADDLGYETIAANGGESYKTPELDRLAEQGTRFEHCYAAPLCTPSRVQIMTGKYNVRNYEGFGHYPKGETSFAELLKQAGYATLIAGKWQLGAEETLPQALGFDDALLWQHMTSGRVRIDGKRIDKRFENPILERNGKRIEYNNGEYAPDLLVDFICEFIEENENQPFLVYYPMILTHCPFVPTPDSDDWDPNSPGSPTYKGDAKYFGDMVSYMDKLVGRIADTVEQQGLSDNTIILFTGDNGTDKPVVSKFKGRLVAGAKGKTTDAGTRVPLIVTGSGIEAQVVSDLVDFTDFLPTLLDIAGAEIPATIDLDGRSFFPQLQGEAGKPRDWVYCWYSTKGQDAGAKVFARTQDYKLYRDGQFFNIPNDPLEQKPLSQTVLTEHQLKVKKSLRRVIDDFNKFR